MTFTRFLSALFLATLLLGTARNTSAQTRAAFTERDISPKIGSEEPGGYYKAFHKSFHDPCKVRVAVFESSGKTVALVGVDALFVPRTVVIAAREKIQSRCGLPPSSVMIGASHSHSSGPVGNVQPGQFDHAPEWIRKLAYEQSSSADPAYLDQLRDAIADAVCDAATHLVPARLGFGSGIEDKVSFNRRIRMKQGYARSHPGKGNPDNVAYAAPIDPEVGVIGAWDSTGKLIGTVVNFSCHATTSPGGISANWIYYLETTIRGALGSQAPVVFLQGACGDITQVDNLGTTQNPDGETWAKIVGGSVGAEAVKVLLRMPTTTNSMVNSSAMVLHIPRRKPAPERVEAATKKTQSGPPATGDADWIFSKEIVLLDSMIAKEPIVDVEVQAIQVGPAVFLSNPAEYFVDYGLTMKKRSPFPKTWIVELANGCVGYVPTLEALGPTGGGYETRLTSYSNLEARAGNRMMETALSLAATFRPDPMPQHPPAPPFKSPWSYGNVPAELK